MKLKTRKSIAKRFLVKRTLKGVKILKLAEGQNHFNSRDTGKTGRNKKSDVTLEKQTKILKTIARAVPYV
jgi:ribosomal protein L35